MMNRRSFVKMGAFAGLLLELGMENNELVFATNKPNVIADVDFDEATILQLQAQLSKGEISSRLLTSFYLKRIIEIDENGVKLNAIIELNPDAIRIATKLDAERKAGKIRSLLHGIPILIKDNIDTADHMKTTAGSLALEGNIAVKDAFIVEKLRNAGAVSWVKPI